MFQKIFVALISITLFYTSLYAMESKTGPEQKESPGYKTVKLSNNKLYTADIGDINNPIDTAEAYENSEYVSPCTLLYQLIGSRKQLPDQTYSYVTYKPEGFNFSDVVIPKNEYIVYHAHATKKNELMVPMLPHAVNSNLTIREQIKFHKERLQLANTCIAHTQHSSNEKNDRQLYVRHHIFEINDVAHNLQRYFIRPKDEYLHVIKYNHEKGYPDCLPSNKIARLFLQAPYNAEDIPAIIKPIFKSIDKELYKKIKAICTKTVSLILNNEGKVFGIEYGPADAVDYIIDFINYMLEYKILSKKWALLRPLVTIESVQEKAELPSFKDYIEKNKESLDVCLKILDAHLSNNV